jgi:hypothetical protein
MSIIALSDLTKDRTPGELVDRIAALTAEQLREWLDVVEEASAVGRAVLREKAKRQRRQPDDQAALGAPRPL